MRSLTSRTVSLWRDKRFACSMLGMMALTFITLLTRPAVGIDDTAFDVYFEDGVAPVMGRWCIFLIHKILPLAYNPYFVEWICVISLTVSVSLWCGVWAKLYGDRASIWAYAFFGCVMLSQPIYAELAPWYLQNGAAWGYGMAALAAHMTMEGLGKGQRGRLMGAVLALTVAVGFYESFMIVYLAGLLLAFFSVRLLAGDEESATGNSATGKSATGKSATGKSATGKPANEKPDKESYESRPFLWLAGGILVAGGAMVTRSLIVRVLTAVFHLESQRNILKSRGLYEVMGWFDGSRGIEELARLAQEFLLKYYINGVVYFPITVLVLAMGILTLAGIRFGAAKKDPWIPVSILGVGLLPWLMAFLEGRASYYRSAQYISLLCGFAAFLVMREFEKKKRHPLLRALGALAAGVLLYRQAYDMNRWLYLDALKYEDARRTMEAVAQKVKETCHTDKPVCIIGYYAVPAPLREWGECPFWSKKYALVSFLAGWMSEELRREYETDYGYRYAETPSLSVIGWGASAFYGFDRELIKFCKLHGIDGLTEDGSIDHYREAEELMREAPVWPGEGSVAEFSDYICVKIGEVE